MSSNMTRAESFIWICAQILSTILSIKTLCSAVLLPIQTNIIRILGNVTYQLKALTVPSSLNLVHCTQLTVTLLLNLSEWSATKHVTWSAQRETSNTYVLKQKSWGNSRLQQFCMTNLLIQSDIGAQELMTSGRWQALWQKRNLHDWVIKISITEHVPAEGSTLLYLSLTDQWMTNIHLSLCKNYRIKFGLCIYRSETASAFPIQHDSMGNSESNQITSKPHSIPYTLSCRTNPTTKHPKTYTNTSVSRLKKFPR